MPRWLAFLLAALLAACGGTDNVHPPSPLPDIQTRLGVHKDWAVDTGDGSGEYFLRLHPYVDDDGRVFVPDHAGQVTAWRLRDGHRLWRVRLEQPVSGGVNGGDGLVVVGSEEGEVIALSAADGQPRWRHAVSSQVFAISPVVEGVLVVRSGDGNIYGLSAADGRQLWKYSVPEPALSLHTQSVPLVARGVALIGLDNGHLLMLALKDGTPLWEKTVAPARGRTELDRMVDIDGRLALVGDTVYVATFQGKVAAIDARRGRVQWSRELSSVNGLDVAGDQLFVTDEDSAVWALDRASGSTLWKQEALKYRWLTAPVVVEKAVVAADYAGYLHWMDREPGSFLARPRADRAGVIAAPRRVGGHVLILGRGGQLSSWRLASD